MEFTFRNNRTNSETFVIKKSKALAEKSNDFAVAADEKIVKVELKSATLTLSTNNAEITMKDTVVYFERQSYPATEFCITPSQASLNKITERTLFELVANDSQYLAEVYISVK
jgi:hypothetical protein